jgi:hypothetical protein
MFQRDGTRLQNEMKLNIYEGVPKLTPDGNTNMEFRISRQDGPEIGRQPLNSWSKYDSYRRSRDLSHPHTILTEGHAIASDPHKKSPQRSKCLPSS